MTQFPKESRRRESPRGKSMLFSPDQLEAIKDAAKGQSHREVGKLFGCSHMTVSRIVRGEVWR